MKNPSSCMSRLFVILALVCGISIHSAQAQPSSGRLVIVRAPNFGWNLVLRVKIDGRTAASIVQGRRFDRPLAAGRHVVNVEAVPGVYFSQPTATVLMVKPGATYTFMAMWQDQYRVVLRPTTLNPTQLAQPIS